MEDWPCRLEVGRQSEYVAVGVGGWLYWHVAPFKHDVRLNVREDGGGRLVVHGLWIEAFDHLYGPGSIAPTELRDIALGRVEGLINAPQYGATVRAGIASEDSEPSFDPTACPLGEAATRAERLPLRRLTTTLRIEVPMERSRNDDFYRHVADTFAVASQTTNKPAVEIADATGVTVTTVHRWIKEARRRGLAGPARRQIPGQIAIDDVSAEI